MNHRLDVDVTYVDSADVQQFKAAIRPNTKVYDSHYRHHVSKNRTLTVTLT